MLVVCLVATPLFAAETPNADRFEIFTVYPRDSKDEKYSVLLDKQSGHMWDLVREIFTIQGTVPTFKMAWTPAIKFESEKEEKIWYEKTQEKLDTMGPKQ